MKKRVMVCVVVLSGGNIFSVQPLEKKNTNYSFGLYKKMATSAVVLSGALASCIALHQKVHNPLSRSLGIAGIFGFTGAALMWMWKTNPPLLNKTFSEKNIEGKVLDLCTLCEETEGQETYKLRVKKIQDLEKTFIQASKDEGFYALLQYDQQKLRKTTKSMNLIVFE
jgi:hypothetical protein